MTSREIKNIVPGLIQVVMSDERYSTKTAEAALLEGRVRRRERRAKRDKIAAAVMLQGYLDSIAEGGSA